MLRVNTYTLLNTLKCNPSISILYFVSRNCSSKLALVSLAYTCVEAENTREKIDIEKLNAKIRQIVAREQELRDEAAKVIPEIEVGV